MTQVSINYGRVLYELSVSPDAVRETAEILERNPRLLRVLQSPIVPLSKKEAIIGKIFSEDIKAFAAIVCKYGHAGLFEEIFRAYQEYYNQQNQIVAAVLYYVTLPTKEQEEGMRNFLKQRYHAADVKLELKEDKSLVGGFILRVRDQEFDYSLKGRINALQQKLIWR